ncbi:MAG: hypothetical protein IPO90_07885, partial [Flavobacteriales bacterium]|nr:hypothetical protein [Flavobacteriales bacterium]
RSSHKKSARKASVSITYLLWSTGLDWGESGADPFSDNAKGYYGTNVRDLSLNQLLS